MSQPKRILVVDDEEQNRDLLEAMLESLGYESELVGRRKRCLGQVECRHGLGASGHHDAEDGWF